MILVDTSVWIAYLRAWVPAKAWSTTEVAGPSNPGTASVPKHDPVVDRFRVAGQSTWMSHWMPGAFASRGSVVSNLVAPDISVNAT